MTPIARQLAAVFLAAGFIGAASLAHAGVMIRVRVPKENEVQAAEQRLSQSTLRMLDGSSPAEELDAHARKLLAEATTTRIDMPARLALLRNAMKQFVLANKWHDALVTVDRMCGEFNLSHAATRGELALYIATKQDGAQPLDFRRPPMDYEWFRALCSDAIEGLIAEQNFALAKKVLEALQAASAGKPSGNRTVWESYAAAIESRSGGREKVADSFNKLQVNPFDAAANDEVARYYHSTCMDWEAALPHVALGSDPEKRTLALRELAQPQTAEAQGAIYESYLRSKLDYSWPWNNHRKEYWSGRLKVVRDGIASSRGIHGLGRYGNTMSGVPAGASTRLGFSSASYLRTNDRVTWNTPYGQVSGYRTVMNDASAAWNDWEAIALNGGSGVSGEGWLMQNAPLVSSTPLAGDLPGFTWTGWVRLENGLATPNRITLMADSADAIDHQQNAVFVELRSNRLIFGVRVRRGGGPDAIGGQVEFEPTASQARDWLFVAATLTHDQHLRLTVNDISKEVPLGLHLRRSSAKWTLVGDLRGSIDEVTFYPRPLSTSEVTALLHVALQNGTVGNAYRNGANMEPVLYQPENGKVARNPNTSTIPSTPVTPKPQPKPVAEKRLLKPTDEELAEATKVVNDVYGNAMATATTPEARLAIVRKLQEAGANKSDMPAIRYVCLREAALLLSKAEVISAVDGWDLIGKAFDVSVAREQLQVLTALQTKARSPNQHKQLCERCIKVFDAALAQDDYDHAKQIAAFCLVSAKGAMSPSFEKTAAAAQERAEVLKTAYEAAAPAREKLKADPTDTSAAFAWGEFLCLYKGDWDAGLPLVVADKSKPLGALADRDQSPAARNDPLAVGEAWWQAADAAPDDISRRALRTRSLFWYRQALPKLTGFDAARIKKRVDDLRKETSPYSAGEVINLLPLLEGSPDVSGRAVPGKDEWELNPGARLYAPLAVYGSYEFSFNIRWDEMGSNNGPQLRVPVGDYDAYIRLGSTEGGLQRDSGTLRIGTKAVEFKKGQAYAIVVQVNLEDENASVRVSVNKRAQISWDGKVNTLSQRLTYNNKLPKCSIQSTAGGSVSALQLKLIDGWVEEVPR